MPAHELTRWPTAVALAAVLCIGGCQGGRAQADRVHVAGGDPARGAAIIEAVGCGACHTIPGIAGARGVVGPPLMFWSRRSYIAGHLPNTPPNLVRWVRNARAVEPTTAMPDLGLDEQEARDVAAFLYTLN